MERNVIVIYGTGNGKTSAAIGTAMKAAADGQNVNLIQFLKGNREGALIELLKRLEPEIKVFRFEKHTIRFSELSADEKQEELNNIRNGLNFAKKVITTHGCDMLVLDEILGLVDRNIMEQEELWKFIDELPEDMSLILTGKTLPAGISERATLITRINNEVNFEVEQ